MQITSLLLILCDLSGCRVELLISRELYLDNNQHFLTLGSVRELGSALQQERQQPAVQLIFRIPVGWVELCSINCIMIS